MQNALKKSSDVSWTAAQSNRPAKSWRTMANTSTIYVISINITMQVFITCVGMLHSAYQLFSLEQLRIQHWPSKNGSCARLHSRGICPPLEVKSALSLFNFLGVSPPLYIKAQQSGSCPALVPRPHTAVYCKMSQCKQWTLCKAWKQDKSGIPLKWRPLNSGHPWYNGQFWMSRLFLHRLQYIRNPWIVDTPLLRITDTFRTPNCTPTILNPNLVDTRRPFSKIAHHRYWS